MMKKYMSICMLLWAAACVMAQQPAPQQQEDYCWGKLPGYPYYYCECRNASTPFQYPVSVDLTDTVWYSASVNDLRQGLCAYWFGDCSVTFEVYAFCSSKTPSFVMTCDPNQMHEMDAAEINRRLDEMGDMAELMSQVLTPRVRVYPNGGTGHVYCYPYDQGPVSTCSAPLPLIPRMTYVCDQTDEVYELQPEKINTNGRGFIRWKHKRNNPATIWLTEGSCNGQELQRATLSDSLRVLLLDAAKLKAAKQAGHSVYVHVSHAANDVGRLYYHNRLLWDRQTIDTTICQGRGLALRDTVLTQTTNYPNDTLWKRGDTLLLTTYHLTITPPEAQYDTLRLKAAQLPTTYRNQYIAKDGWGDYDFTIHQTGSCDERYLVHVLHLVQTYETTLDTTVCLGKTITLGGVSYTTDTVVRDSAWADADTWVISDVTIRFSEPEPEYDTISVRASDMTARGYWYADLGVMVQYGDTLIVKTKKNTCTRWIYLTVLEMNTTAVENTLQSEEAYRYMRDGVIYIRRQGREYDLLGRPTNRQ